jgi:hypothetical protein
MAAVSRQKMHEGWEVDVPAEAGMSYVTSLREKLADNGKLWLLALLAIAACTAVGLKYSKQSDLSVEAFQKLPPAPREGAISEDMRGQFVQDLLDDKDFGSILANVRFVGPDVLRISLKPSASLDETDYLAKMAGQRFLKKFKARLVVMSFSQDIRGTETLVGTTRWSKEKYGYVTRIRRVEVVPEAG